MCDIKRPSKYRVRSDNKHFEGEAVLRLRGVVTTEWERGAGYDGWVEMEDPVTHWRAVYGWHKPSERWHLWAN